MAARKVIAAVAGPFDDAPPTVALGLNVPMCYTDAYTAFGIKCIVAPKVPNDYASLACIRTTAPEGSILNTKHPAAVAARSTIGHMLPDVMFGCLIQALPHGVPAEGTSCLWNLRLMGGLGRAELSPEQMKTATPYNVMSFHSGGTEHVDHILLSGHHGFRYQLPNRQIQF